MTAIMARTAWDAPEAADGPQVMVIQHGARRNYIYPRQLQAAGMLSSLVCDAAWPEGRPGPMQQLLRGVAPRLAGPIARRTVRGVDPAKLRASLWPNLTAAAKRLMHEERAYYLIDETHAARARARGLEGADVVLSYHGNGGSFLDDAKRAGAKVAVDFVITPKYLQIEQAERERWPGWESRRTPPEVIAFYRRRMTRLVGLADLYLCPSEAVARDLADLPGFDPARVRITPYGVSGVLVKPPKPVPGRVLFAGAAGLRKGLPYLAAAASLLKAARPDIEVLVAGGVTDAVRARPETRDLIFLGKLEREAMAEAFAGADLFCLPSLAEGSATVVFEAMANGLPVVTTAASGSVVRDGAEGLIVPERDAEAIAAAVLKIVDERALRTAMSRRALACAARHSDEACGEVFIAAMRELATRG